MLLGSEAVYRVCACSQTLVELEVVRAPGLQAGQRFQFAVAAVTEMAIVCEPGDPTAAPVDSN